MHIEYFMYHTNIMYVTQYYNTILYYYYIIFFLLYLQTFLTDFEFTTSYNQYKYNDLNMIIFKA